MGDSIVRKTDRVLNKGDDVVVCLSGAKIEAITERVENIVGSGKGGPVLVHVGTNNVDREGTTAIVRKYRQLVRTLKQTRVEQVILSGILPVMGRRDHKYRNCRGMAINMLVQKLCREEEVGFEDLWGSFVGRADMYMKDGLHVSGKGAAVFAETGYRCVCLNARSIVNKKNELKTMVEDIDPYIIGITESWANIGIPDAELGLTGYVMFRKDRIGRRGGGVILYVKESIQAYEIKLEREADCDEAVQNCFRK